MIKINAFEEYLDQLQKQSQLTKDTKSLVQNDLLLSPKSYQSKLTFLNSSNLSDSFTPDLLDLILAETMMFKGVLRFLGGQKFKAFLVFRECWKIYRRFEQLMQKGLLAEDPDVESRVQLGLGLFYLGISALPKSLTTLIRLVGFTSGNRERGITYLTQCMQSRRSRAPYASLLLLLFHLD